MSNIHTNSLSSLLQTFIKRAEEEELAIVCCCAFTSTPTQKGVSRIRGVASGAACSKMEQITQPIVIMPESAILPKINESSLISILVQS